MEDYADLIATCDSAARAGADQLEAWRGRFAAREKASRDLVTEADFASQEAISAVIKARYPEHGLLGEERPDRRELDKPYCWIVDPLDGTTNYVHGFPCYAVSVAVAYQGLVVAGAIYDPLRQESFLAATKKGSQLNGQSIRVSDTSELTEALVAVSFPPDLKRDSPDLQTFLEIAPRFRAVRRTGSAALNLAYVACGRLDAHWAHFIHPWDSAAGVLLVQEAGGVATASRGGEFSVADGDYCVAATEELHRATLPLINSR